MSWKLTTQMRPSDPPESLDAIFHEARFGKSVSKEGVAELNLDRATHQALDMHRTVQLDAVNHLSRESNAVVTVESSGHVDADNLGSYTIKVTIQ